MNFATHIPKFVSVVTILLGVLDLIRATIHTVFLEYAALNIAGLELGTAQGADILQLMGVFGISNYLTGIMLIMLGWKMRPFALAMLGIIPATYFVGVMAIRIYSAPYSDSQAAWGGANPMLVYLSISAVTFILGVAVTWMRSWQAKTEPQQQFA